MGSCPHGGPALASYAGSFLPEPPGAYTSVGQEPHRYVAMHTESLALLIIHGPEPCAPKLALYLTSHGMRVTAVANELDAQLEARARLYDCVVVDFGRNGRRRGVMFTRALRAEQHMPIVLITPGHEVGERVEILDAGADDCVSASCSDRELLSRIRASIRRARRLG